MWQYPSINPVALDLGAVQIHWYGLMYLLGFLSFWIYGNWKAKHNKIWNSDKVSDFLFYAAVGVILGGRLGFVLFYDLSFYISNPTEILSVWKGGMSFHGGLIGVSIAMLLFARKEKLNVIQISDFVAPIVPAGLFFGRIGNFINGELWGKVTESQWGMLVYDEKLQQTVARYPTQLLEALLEGLVLFIILFFYSNKPRPRGTITGLFLSLYGGFRFIVEFFRVPDTQLGYLYGEWLTMGQVLSIPMIIIGLGMIIYAHRKTNKR